MPDDDDYKQTDSTPATLVVSILSGLIRSEKYCRKVLPHLKTNYFEGPERTLYDLILSFISRYNRLPNATVLDVEFQQCEEYSRIENVAHVEALIQQCGRSEHKDVDVDWLVDTTEKWCKERAMFLAVMEAITIIDGKGKDGKSQGAIPELMQSALSVSFDTNVGHDYIEDADKRFEHYHALEDKMPFDIEMLNKITKGGVNRKTLNIILAGCVHPDTRVKIRFRKKKP